MNDDSCLSVGIQTWIEERKASVRVGGKLTLLELRIEFLGLYSLLLSTYPSRFRLCRKSDTPTGSVTKQKVRTRDIISPEATVTRAYLSVLPGIPCSERAEHALRGEYFWDRQRTNRLSPPSSRNPGGQNERRARQIPT